MKKHSFETHVYLNLTQTFSQVQYTAVVSGAQVIEIWESPLVCFGHVPTFITFSATYTMCNQNSTEQVTLQRQSQYMQI